MVTAVLAIVTMATVLVLVGAIGLVAARATSATAASIDDWLDAPILGIALIVVVLQPIAALGLPVGRSAWLFSSAVLAGGFVLVRRGRLRGVLASCPWAACGLVAVVLAVHGLGLGIAGPEAYAGRGWGDQVNYTSITHYVTAYPLGRRPPASDPMASIGYAYSYLRIGQSVVQSYLAVTLGVSPKVVFEPLILLSPALTALALLATGRVLQMPPAVGVLLAAAGALTPALATLHLESFLSHALAVPLVLHLPALLARLGGRSASGVYGRLALVFSACCGIYLEYLPLAAAVIIAGVFVTLPAVEARWLHLLRGLAVLAMPAVLGLGRGFTKTFSSVNAPVLGAFYPWAFSIEGLQRLWFGDLSAAGQPGDVQLVKITAILLLVAGVHGVLRLVEEQHAESRRDCTVYPRMAAAVCLLGVIAVPAAVFLRTVPYPYQFYKTLMGAMPVLAWGASYTIWRLVGPARGPGRQWPVLVLLVLLPAACTVGVVDMVLASSDPHLSDAEQVRRRQTTKVMLDTSFLDTVRHLEGLSGGDAFLCVTDTTWNAAHANAWLALAARHNRVWVLNPRLNDQDARVMAGPDYWARVPRPTATAHFVSGGPGGALSTTRSTDSPGPRPYTVRPWDGGTVLCGPSMVSDPVAGPSMTLLPSGNAVTLLAERSGTTLLQYREDPAVAPLVARIGGLATPARSRHGVAILPLTTRAGAEEVTLEHAPGRPPASRVSDLVLRDPAHELPLVHIGNPNGVELLEGGRFFWLGTEAAEVEYFSPCACEAELVLSGWPGPSLPTTPVRRIAVRPDGGTAAVGEMTGKTLTVRVRLQEGFGVLRVQAQDVPTATVASDPRVLMVGVRDLTLRLVTPATRTW